LRDGVRAYAIDINGTFKKVSFENQELTIWVKESKMFRYELETGAELFVSGHNGEKLSKEEKKLRKKQYISKIENEKRKAS